MSKRVKKLSLFMCCCAVLCVLCAFSGKAASYSASYDTTSRVELATVVNDTANSLPLSLNTRPTSGEGGVRVIVTKSDGTVVVSHVFPYHVSIPDYSVNVPSGQVRRIYVEPATAGQRVVGVLSYSF